MCDSHVSDSCALSSVEILKSLMFAIQMTTELAVANFSQSRLEFVRTWLQRLPHKFSQVSVSLHLPYKMTAELTFENFPSLVSGSCALGSDDDCRNVRGTFSVFDGVRCSYFRERALYFRITALYFCKRALYFRTRALYL